MGGVLWQRRKVTVLNEVDKDELLEGLHVDSVSHLGGVGDDQLEVVYGFLVPLKSDEDERLVVEVDYDVHWLGILLEASHRLVNNSH